MPAGKLGLITRDRSRFALTLENYLRLHPVTGAGGGLEPVADSEDVDRASRVASWPMYMNGEGDPGNPPASPDGIGDCTIAGWCHADTAMGEYAGYGQHLFADSEVLAAYSAVSGYDPATGANDNGAQMQDVLAYMRSTGMQDVNGKLHTVVAYAALGNPADITLLSECLKTFGAVYLGVNLQQAQEEAFGQGPWLYVPGSPVLGGHAISLHRRQPYGSRVGVFAMSTWGALQPSTISFIQGCVQEAWVFCSEDWIEANGETCDGIMLAQLLSDMKYV